MEEDREGLMGQSISGGGLLRYSTEQALEWGFDLSSAPMSTLYLTSAPTTPSTSKTVNSAPTTPSTSKTANFSLVSSEEEHLDKKTSEKKVSDVDNWHQASILALINLYQEQEKGGNSPFPKVFWGTVSEELKKSKFLFSTEQCKNKMNNLKAQFKLQKLKKEKSGSGKMVWPFYDAMNSFMGDKPEIQPVALASDDGKVTLKNKKSASDDGKVTTKNKKRALSANDTASGSDAHDEFEALYDSEDTEQDHTQAKSVKRNNSVSSTPKRSSDKTTASVLETMNDDANKRHRERMEMKEKGLVFFQKFLDKM